ncbi:MAG: hypothetical protein QM831_04795 [Kofleriaceae bacterium]
MKNEWMNLVWVTLVLALLVVLQACNPTLMVESPSPPGRVARMDSVDNWLGITQWYRLEITAGVAVALTCNNGSPCEHMTITSPDPKIAELRNASLSALKKTSPYSSLPQQQTAAGLVVVGKTPGKTTLHVKTEHQGERDIVVTVVAPAIAGAN